MRKVIYITIFFTLIISNTFAKEKVNKSDKELSSKIIGAWKHVLEKPGLKIIGFNSFRKNGVLKSYAKLISNKKEKLVYFSGKWKIENGYLIDTITESTLPKLIPVGKITKDKIIEISDEIFKYKTKRGDVMTMLKLVEDKYQNTNKSLDLTR